MIETVACQHLINRRKLLSDATPLREAYLQANRLAAMLQSLRKTITPDQPWLREPSADYAVSDNDEDSNPFDS